MRFTNQLSNYLEEMSRKDDGPVGKCLQLWLHHTLADKLWTPFKTIVFSPFITLTVVCIVYIIFCIIYAPLWAASLFITRYGAYFLLLLILNYIAVTLARSIAYPGSNIAVRKQMSADFIRRLSIQLETIANLLSDFTASVLLGATGEVTLLQIPALGRRYSEVLIASGTISRMLPHLEEAVDFLSSKKDATTAELKLMKALTTSIAAALESINALSAPVKEYISSFESKIRSRSQQMSPTAVHRGSAELVKLASTCLKAAEALKVAAVDARPIGNSEGEDATNVTSALKQLLNFNKGLEGCERLTFPYMRSLLKHRYAAERFTIPGRSSNHIDGIFLPAAAFNNSSSSSSSNNNSNSSSSSNSMSSGNRSSNAPAGASSNQKSSKGVVLFCSPNAGFYELLAHTDMSMCWMGFYLERGYDVCMFNYRGYGLSTGTPGPMGAKYDACEVYKFVQNHKQPPKLIIHGESIGGMSASYVARHFPVDVLICDRTFASLESTAVRLLGSWAAYGLQFFAWWSTDVTSDYVACTCPKLILQDHNDEIIHDVAGLKNGVALRIVMGDATWKAHAEPRDYNYASYINAPLPNTQKEAQWLATANDLAQQIPEAFIVHFYGCLMDVSKRATAANFVKRRAAAGRRMLSQQDVSIGTSSGTAGDLLQQEIAESSSTNYRNATSLNSGGDLELVQDAVESIGDSMHSNITTKHNSPPPIAGLSSSSSSSSNNNNDQGEVGEESDGCSDADLTREQRMRFSSRLEWLENFCSLSIHDNSAADPRLICNPQTKAWTVIARIDGGSGQLLGQALAKGLDCVRAWVSAYIVWLKHSAVDPSLPKGCTTMAVAINEMELLMSSLHRADLADIPSMKFLKQAFACILKRQEAFRSHVPAVSLLLYGASNYHTRSNEATDSVANSSNSNGNSSSSNGNRDVSGSGGSIEDGLRSDVVACFGGEQSPLTRLVRSNSHLHTTVSFMSSCIRPTLWWRNIRYCMSSNPYIPVESCGSGADHPTGSDTASNSPHSNDGGVDASTPFGVAQSPLSYVGSLIPLHCGHNGWPSNHALKTFEEFLDKNVL